MTQALLSRTDGECARVTQNAAWGACAPELSILIPFKSDDPTRLLAALDAAPSCEVEIILLDDGSRDSDLAQRVSALVSVLRTAARLLVLDQNEGRARGRNRLVGQARARHFLFLDSDMLPDQTDFVARWLDLAKEDIPVAFGGFSLQQCPPNPDHDLHRVMAARGDCVPAELRSLTPEKYVFTSNLLVRRDVFAAEAFDEAFTGWGWEDVEWAMRVSALWPIRHLDNTATHLGLDTAATIAAKYEQSAANFARAVTLHPQVISTYPSYRAARLLSRIPFLGLWRVLLKGYALSAPLPVRSRAFAMRLYRAALYAGVLK